MLNTSILIDESQVTSVNNNINNFNNNINNLNSQSIPLKMFTNTAFVDKHIDYTKNDTKLDSSPRDLHNNKITINKDMYIKNVLLSEVKDTRIPQVSKIEVSSVEEFD